MDGCLGRVGPGGQVGRARSDSAGEWAGSGEWVIRDVWVYWACSGHAGDWAVPGPILSAAAWDGTARAGEWAELGRIVLVSGLGRVSGLYRSCGVTGPVPAMRVTGPGKGRYCGRLLGMRRLGRASGLG